MSSIVVENEVEGLYMLNISTVVVLSGLPAINKPTSLIYMLPEK
jgi:hypothetical protein